MNVLGISCYYHDSAAALIRDGRVVCAVEEERFTRRKHDNGFPRNSIRFCLDYARVDPKDVDLVVFYDKPLKKLERALVSAKPHGDKAKSMIDWHVRNYVHRESKLAADIADALGVERPLQFSEHHLSHASSVFYASPYEEAAVLTIDGVGEWATTGVYVGKGNRVEQLKEIHYPHSLGLFYATMTAYLGFEVNEGEYKVMGLASYGKPTFMKEVANLLEFHEDGSYTNVPGYYSYEYDDQKMYTPKLVELLGPARAPNEPVTERHMNIGASLQKLCEEAMIHLAKSVRKETGLDSLCMAGGVAHNVVANSRVLAEAGFKNLWVQPASGDSGCAVGAALEGYYRKSGAKRTPDPQYDTCLGPNFPDEQVEEALSRFGAEYQKYDSDGFIAKTAELIAQNFVIGWFQGRMEFGPRALGCRSILANPCSGDMKEILNARVKHREEFRPFAPAVVEERAAEFFLHPGKSPYMLFCPQVKAEKKTVIPAVTHVDGTARVQTVSKTTNPRFHQLITAVGERTGAPVVINTSFNIRGEPIVCTPDDALKCFYGTDIDFLCIGNFIVSKTF